MGILLFGIMFFTFLGVLWLASIWETIKLIFNLLYISLISTYRYFTIKKPLKNNGFFYKKELENKILESEKNLKQQKKLLEQQDIIIKASLYKINKLKEQFPHADENLFQLYFEKYPIYAIHELEIIKNIIKCNHMKHKN